MWNIQVLFGTAGPITLIYEMEFYAENGREIDKEVLSDARENMCIMQLVMFPPTSEERLSKYSSL